MPHAGAWPMSSPRSPTPIAGSGWRATVPAGSTTAWPGCATSSAVTARGRPTSTGAAGSPALGVLAALARPRFAWPCGQNAQGSAGLASSGRVRRDVVEHDVEHGAELVAERRGAFALGPPL